jgi:hypothetical protein
MIIHDILIFDFPRLRSDDILPHMRKLQLRVAKITTGYNIKELDNSTIVYEIYEDNSVKMRLVPSQI